MSAARGWRWPTGADHGLVVVSFDAYATGAWTASCTRILAVIAATKTRCRNLIIEPSVQYRLRFNSETAFGARIFPTWGA